jgi:hypothetical protein
MADLVAISPSTLARRGESTAEFRPVAAVEVYVAELVDLDRKPSNLASFCQSSPVGTLFGQDWATGLDEAEQGHAENL